ncbi:MAG: sigma-70 family RNA polymerase sigma factor [Anaerolineae bacterium]
MQDERELIRRAKEYDPSAFAEIYERYYQRIYNYIYYRISDGVMAEDLCSEVFVKTLEAIDSYTFQGVPFSAWLYRIASNLVIDHYRRQPVQPEMSWEDGRPLVTDENPGVSLERHFDHQELRRALRGLTSDQQQVIILKFVDGLSNNEVAHILGKTEGAVKSLQHRALASLGRLMGEKRKDGAYGKVPRTHHQLPKGRD